MGSELKHLEKDFVEKNNCLKWVSRHVFVQIKFVHDSNLLSPTKETSKVPANGNETVTKAYMVYVTTALSRHWFNQSFKKKFKQPLNNFKAQVTFTENLALN